MKAEILADGTLKITSQTDIEHYALAKWFEGYSNRPSSSVLQIDITAEAKDQGETVND